MKSAKTQGLVLAVQPCARGFGWVLFEGDMAPVVWGVARPRSDLSAWSMRRFERLLNQYQPSVVVLENLDEESRRSERIRDLVQMMRGFADNRDMDTPVYTRSEVGAAVLHDEKATHHALATAVGFRLPVLQQQLPPKRTLWEPEHDRQCLFDAAALGITHYTLTHQS